MKVIFCHVDELLHRKTGWTLPSGFTFSQLFIIPAFKLTSPKVDLILAANCLRDSHECLPSTLETLYSRYLWCLQSKRNKFVITRRLYDVCFTKYFQNCTKYDHESVRSKHNWTIPTSDEDWSVFSTMNSLRVELKSPSSEKFQETAWVSNRLFSTCIQIHLKYICVEENKRKWDEKTQLA